MKTILNNKWHLHAIALIFSVLIMYAFETQKDLGESFWWSKTFFGNVARFFIATFAGFVAGGTVEILQGLIFKAHQGKEGLKASTLDWIVTASASFVGCILYFLINTWWLIGVTAGIILCLELYKRITK